MTMIILFKYNSLLKKINFQHIFMKYAYYLS